MKYIIESSLGDVSNVCLNTCLSHMNINLGHGRTLPLIFLMSQNLGSNTDAGPRTYRCIWVKPVQPVFAAVVQFIFLNQDVPSFLEKAWAKCFWTAFANSRHGSTKWSTSTLFWDATYRAPNVRAAGVCALWFWSHGTAFRVIALQESFACRRHWVILNK